MENIISPEQATALSGLFSNAKRIVITCHQNPDGDALGSSLALYSYLREIGKAPVVLVPDQYPDFLRWLPDVDKVVRFDKSKNLASMLVKQADLLCCMDYSQQSRCGDEMAALLESSKAEKIVIDHHEGSTIQTPWLYVYPEMSSTCEALFRLIQDMGGDQKINKKVATCLYCGLMTDTGNFAYSSNRPEIFLMVGRLLQSNIDKDKIFRNVYHTFSFNRLRFWGYVLHKKLHFLPEYEAAYFCLSKEEMAEMHYIKGDAEGLVNQPLQIKGCKLSISLREDNKIQRVWVSLRSVDDVNCIELAEKYFNGGGHLNAAGGNLQCSIAEAEAIVRKAIAETMKKS